MCPLLVQGHLWVQSPTVLSPETARGEGKKACEVSATPLVDGDYTNQRHTDSPRPTHTQSHSHPNKHTHTHLQWPPPAWPAAQVVGEQRHRQHPAWQQLLRCAGPQAHLDTAGCCHTPARADDGCGGVAIVAFAAVVVILAQEVDGVMSLSLFSTRGVEGAGTCASGC